MRSDLTIDAAELPTAAAIGKFERAGCLKLANFIESAKVEALREAALDAVGTCSQSIQVGTARYMVSVPISGVLGCADLYAPTGLRDCLSIVLGEKFVLNCFTCITAKPGAPANSSLTAGPTRRAPSRPDAAHRAVEMAGIRALKKAEAAGVFRRLPKDKYARWRVIDVTFTPREIVFL